MENKKVLIMAGGTGGHVFPGLALAEEMSGRGYAVNWLGTRAGIESKLVPESKIPLYFIPVKGIRGKGLKSLVMAPWTIVSSIYAAFSIVKNLQPNIVVGLGGFVAGPGGIAAKLLGVPLVVHEQNAVAGTTNRILARFSRRVLLAFPCQLKNGVCIGNPVRKEIEAIVPPEKRFKNRADVTNLLVIGGSRGALAINELVPAALRLLARNDRIKVWHQAGESKDEITRVVYQKAGVNAKIEAFIDDIAEAYSWADVVICRSGALTVSELAAAGLGSILIPFPYAIDDHQTKNAEYLKKAGAAIIRQQNELTTEKFVTLLEAVLFDRKKLMDMANSAKTVAKLNAVGVFADHCEEVING